MLIPIDGEVSANIGYRAGGVVQRKGAEAALVVVEMEVIDEDENIVDEDALIVKLSQSTLSCASSKRRAIVRWMSMDNPHWWVVEVGVNQVQERSVVREEGHEGATRLSWW